MTLYDYGTSPLELARLRGEKVRSAVHETLMDSPDGLIQATEDGDLLVEMADDLCQKTGIEALPRNAIVNALNGDSDITLTTAARTGDQELGMRVTAITLKNY